MDREDFAPAQQAFLISSPRGYLAFRPPALPPIIAFTSALLNKLSEADRAIGELAGVGSKVTDPWLLISPFLRKEAVLSSKIEGTQTTLSELVLFEATQQPPSPHSDVREVFNYLTALEHALDPQRTLPISLRLLRDLHRMLLTGVRGSEASLTPGELRTSQNWIGPPGCTLNEAVFVPPPDDHLLDALSELERYTHHRGDLPPLIRIALIHYQFEAIHPFLDGNGRVGRLLITLLLVEEKLLTQPLLYLSAYFDRYRDRYYSLLLQVSRKGTWEGWLTYFLDGVTVQARDAIERSQRLLELRSEYHALISTVRTSALLHKLVDALFERPVITVPYAKELLGVTHRAARLNIEKLVTAGILRDLQTPRPRRFMAEGILRVMQKD